MALLGPNIDQTLVAGLTSTDVASYTHALPAPPHIIQVRFNAVTGATCSFVGIRAYTASYTNSASVVFTNGIEVQNAGSVQSPNMEITAICFHSLIQ